MWNDRFIDLFQRCVNRYQAGDRDFTRYYESPLDAALLAEIGYQPREFFDFVEDFCEEGDPSPSTALLIAAVRRDYFHVVMKGQPGTRQLTANDLPTFGDEIHGIAYLPRILAKARAKLRGELDPNLMFGCGGDRAFLARHGDLHPADFLRQVWAAGDDDSKLVARLLRH
ncbi:MAG: hypothetical protein EAZ65_08840 [Verrucomicrobia bacterium]|nr:MAG: hypothetical protein EAZ84_09135 [Verrucomicrobiota bacterium]TAE86226.1 MAG: hypothetical protein EAZ82_11860 [Verrucomicrobiota bacterium]TAF23672.1 MAG: hypothetical protein EAZ71_12470 [Verrucomicrobiota bacterium]TAF40215.1 MAG: hypothetical protein EAZ65_08840 [Verrucomicrobiota bacterium]